jgi:anti-sigma regulatory factor (Ser/Thr protein kinase)
MTSLLTRRDAVPALSSTWPGTDDSIREARHWVETHLAASGVTGTASHSAVTVVSELAANAIKHTRSGKDGGRFEVALGVFSTRVCVAVADQGGGGTPVAANIDPDAIPLLDELPESGMGLFCISKLSLKWGHRPLGDGLQLWALIAR